MLLFLTREEFGATPADEATLPGTPNVAQGGAANSRLTACNLRDAAISQASSVRVSVYSDVYTNACGNWRRFVKMYACVCLHVSTRTSPMQAGEKFFLGSIIS